MTYSTKIFEKSVTISTILTGNNGSNFASYYFLESDDNISHIIVNVEPNANGRTHANNWGYGVTLTQEQKNKLIGKKITYINRSTLYYCWCGVGLVNGLTHPASGYTLPPSNNGVGTQLKPQEVAEFVFLEESNGGVGVALIKKKSLV